MPTKKTSYNFDLKISVARGSVAFYLLRSYDEDSFHIWAKLKHVDDGQFLPNGNPSWHQNFAVTQGGEFTLDFPDWDGDPVIEVSLFVDGAEMLYANGSGDNMDQWVRRLRSGVYQSSDRQIKFNLALLRRTSPAIMKHLMAAQSLLLGEAIGPKKKSTRGG